MGLFSRKKDKNSSKTSISSKIPTHKIPTEKIPKQKIPKQHVPGKFPKQEEAVIPEKRDKIPKQTIKPSNQTFQVKRTHDNYILEKLKPTKQSTSKLPKSSKSKFNKVKSIKSKALPKEKKKSKSKKPKIDRNKPLVVNNTSLSNLSDRFMKYPSKILIKEKRSIESKPIHKNGKVKKVRQAPLTGKHKVIAKKPKDKRPKDKKPKDKIPKEKVPK